MATLSLAHIHRPVGPVRGHGLDDVGGREYSRLRQNDLAHKPTESPEPSRRS